MKVPVDMVKTVVAVVAGATLALPAHGQIAPGRSGTSTQQTYGGEVAWRELASFGRCFAKQEQADAFRLIATQPGSREEAETYVEIFKKQNQSCLGSITSLKTEPQFVRGAIAEGLYRASIPVPLVLVRTAPAKEAEIRTISDAASCYASSHPREVRALLLNTIPGGDSENTAVKAMIPEFSKCVPPKARNLTFRATQIRYRLAEALLRLPASPPARDN